MSFLSHFSTLKLASGAIQPINVEGQNFWVVHAPVDLQIRLSGGEFATYGQGTGLDNLPGGGTFSRLEIRNPSLGAITVGIYIGGPLYRDSRAAVMEPKTEGDGWNGTQLLAGAGVTFDGIPSGDRIRRKSIQVTNLDVAARLQLRDADTHVILEIFGETSINLPVSESIQVWNPNGAAVACAISEIWWTL